MMMTVLRSDRPFSFSLVVTDIVKVLQYVAANIEHAGLATRIWHADYRVLCRAADPCSSRDSDTGGPSEIDPVDDDKKTTTYGDGAKGHPATVGKGK